MILHLLKNGKPLLTARSAHVVENSVQMLPVTYEGDVSLIPGAMSEANVDMLESIFTLLARKHGLDLTGDYRDMIMKHNLKIPMPN